MGQPTTGQFSLTSLYYCDILIFYISVILYSYAGGYKCRLTTFPTRFAHDVYFVLLSLLCFIVIVVP